MTIGAFKNSCI